MKHVHYLHSQHYHYMTTRFAEGGCYAQPQFFATIDHVLEHVIDRVLVHARAVGNDLSHFTTYLAQKTRRTRFRFMSWIVREDSPQIAIVNSGPLEVVTLALAAVMFAQREPQRRKRFDFRARTVLRFRARDLFHQLVDVLELLQRRPTAITASPLRSRRQPHGESFREVFRRMCLRIPRRQMQNILSTLWSRFVEVWIRLRKRAEQFAVLPFEVQTKSSIERVSGLVTEDAHALRIRAAFDFQHLPTFELHQSRMRQVKRDGDTRHAVGRKPLFR